MKCHTSSAGRSLSFALLLVLVGSLQLSCRSKPTPQDLTSLRRSGAVTFLCVGTDRKPAALSECALGDINEEGGIDVGPPGYDLLALVTQTRSAEVAVINTSATGSGGDSLGKVLDVDVTNPGVTPLRVGAQPVGIATTPGSSASFVTVAEPGKEGIFALPTRCIFAPTEDETRRDLTTWPACRLPSTPGDVRVIVDAAAEGDGFCRGAPPASSSGEEHECSVDLADEVHQPGRRKLVVALPFEGKLVVIDAQELLDRPPGSYQDCFIEAELPLTGLVPGGLEQPLPDDLASEGVDTMDYPELAGDYQPRPAGMDWFNGVLAVADRAAPLIHMVDVRNPCELREFEPLYTASFASPARVVTTSKVAISPVTKRGEQFLYAVDDVGEEMASIIPFDISATSASRLPLLRPGAPLLPFEPPDRLSFAAAVKDVAFAQLDLPVSDPVVGQSITKVECDPNPNLSDDALSAQYRRSSDTIGASPGVLRGTFAYALLSDGRVMVIDIEDYDAACRRPIQLNPLGQPDFRGCFNDDERFDYYTDDQTETGSPTVSDEASCRVFVPHRTRSGRYFETNEGGSIQAPAVRSFVRLTRFDRTLPMTRQVGEGKKNPILLGVPFEAPDGGTVPAQVYVGSTLMRTDDIKDPLVIDPNVAERSLPVLPFIEPRAYPTSEVVNIVYEGDIDRERGAGEIFEPSGGVSRFEDAVGSFCGRGVQGRELTEEMGRERFNLSSGSLERFVARHTDYLQITNLLLDEDDVYWSNAGASCGDDGSGTASSGYELCDSVFRIGDTDDLAEGRDFEIVSARDDELLITPRGDLSETRANERLNLARCCFPGAISYRIRAGNQWAVVGAGTGFQHPVIADESAEERTCIYDPSPLSAYQWGRAFEVSNLNCTSTNSSSPDACGVGPRTTDDVVCSYDASTGGVSLRGAASECIFSSLTKRFVIYRGLEPSSRDSTFAMEVVGGFEGLGIPVTANSSNVLPMAIAEVENLPILGVVDSQNNGLVVLDLLSSRVAQSFY